MESSKSGTLLRMGDVVFSLGDNSLIKLSAKNVFFRRLEGNLLLNSLFYDNNHPILVPLRYVTTDSDAESVLHFDGDRYGEKCLTVFVAESSRFDLTIFNEVGDDLTPEVFVKFLCKIC
jgi:hypothetical protein